MEALAGGGIWLGVAIGFVAGAAFQSFRHAVQNLRKTKESIPGLKKTAAGARWRSAGWLLVVASYAAIVLLSVSNVR